MANVNTAIFRDQLNDHPLGLWLDEITPAIEARLRPDSQRNFPAWLAALDAIPEQKDARVHLDRDTITTVGEATDSDPQIRQALEQLKPWRKGPFRFNDIALDTEWRSDWKWKRIAPHIELDGLDVLDVGCGNGYYSLRMLGAGARRVVGLDTSLLYWAQFQAISRFTGDHRATVLPLSVECLTGHPYQFDAIFSMGVLYHRRQPQEHLMLLQHSLPPGGMLVLETLILHGHRKEELVPPGRYANMRNVWSLPTVPMVFQQLMESGFSRARCVDITQTTTSEQRTTAWMPFNSLSDALDDSDTSLTIEGHPAPLRVVIIAEK